MLAADGSDAVSIYVLYSILDRASPYKAGGWLIFDRNRSVRTSVLACVSG